MQPSIEELDAKYQQLQNIVKEKIPSRSEELIAMYEDLGDRVVLAPASSYEHFHNCFPGGYIDHILRVYEFSLQMYNSFKVTGMNTDDFTEEELVFAALHHDLGKLGFPGEGNERYLLQTDTWRQEKLGHLYTQNPNNPMNQVPDLSIYLLNYYGITYSWEEFVAIKIHDGLYDEGNKAYYTGGSRDNKLRSNLPYIIHFSDLMASRFEYERWQKEKGTFTLPESSKKIYGRQKKNKKLGEIANNNIKESTDAAELFKDLFSSVKQ